VKTLLLSIYRTALFAALAFGPLALIAMRNPHALPVGLFAFGALIVVSPVAWIAYVQSPLKAGIIGFAMFVLLAWLTVMSFRFAAAGASGRALWSVGSVVAWMIAFYLVPAALRSVWRNAEMDRSIAKGRAEQTAIEQARDDLSAHPEKRQPVLDSTRAWFLERFGPAIFLGHARYLTFGDPARDPAHVSIWAVMTLNEYQRFDVFSQDLKQLFVELNYWLGKAGYSWTVAAGAVDEREVAAAGGDEAYFGRYGERVTPQWTADRLDEARRATGLPALAPPLRRGPS
jgi:hypothetical protein